MAGGDGAGAPSSPAGKGRGWLRLAGAVAAALALSGVVLALAGATRDGAAEDSLKLWPIAPDARDGGIGANALLSRLDGEVLAALDAHRLRQDLRLSPTADPSERSSRPAIRQLKLVMSLFVSYLPAKPDDPVASAIDLGSVTAMATSFSDERPYPMLMLMATSQPVRDLVAELRVAGYQLRGGILEWRGSSDDVAARYVAVGEKFIALAHERGDLVQALGRSERASSVEGLLSLDGTLRIGRRLSEFCVPSIAFSEDPAALRGKLILRGESMTASRVVFGDRGSSNQQEGIDQIKVRGISRRPTGLAIDYDYADADYRHTPAPLLLLDPPAGVLMYRCSDS